MYRFVAILGDAGSGKTSLLTAFLVRAARRHRAVIANYHLHNVPYKLMPFETLATLPAEAAHARAGFDELGRGADSYDFFMEHPRKLALLVSQSRKRDLEVYFTTQRLNLVAKRIRDQVSGYILMEDLDAQKPGHTKQNCNALFHCDFYDSFRRYIKEENFDGRPWQNYYNTDEIIDWKGSSDAKTT